MKNLFLFLLLIQISIIQAQDLYEGRIAYYPFNGSANDEVGNLNGDVHGASLAQDRFGNNNSAFSFDGSNDFIEIPHNQLMNFGVNDDFTISLWIKVAKVQNDMEGTNNGIIGKWDEYNDSSYPFAIRYWNKNESSSREERIYALRYDSNSCSNNPAVSASCKITSEVWHHILLRKKGNQIAYFQDGVLQGVEEDNTSTRCDTKNNEAILIGKRKRDQRYFTGWIDDIIFYNRAITNEEIFLLFSENGWNPTASQTEIVSFSFPEQLAPAIIDTRLKTIAAKVSCDADLTNLIANFSLSNNVDFIVNGVPQQSGVSANDFSHPVTYTLNECLEAWTVTVTKEQFNQEEIDKETAFQSFNLPGQKGSSVIDINTHHIKIEIPCGNDITNLIPIFSLPLEAHATVEGRLQESGITSHDFSDTVFYRVFDKKRCMIQDWSITVLKHKLSFKEVDFNSKNYFLPNIITPNGDSKNQNFQIGDLLLNSEMSLYNRYGRRVYFNRSYGNDFDGNNLSSGVYFYTIKSSCVEKVIKGYLHIVKK